MENREFLLHMKIIKEMFKTRNARIILLHPPYNESQQKIIDAICRQSHQIIGQVERKLPMKNTAKEIQRLILAHKEPFIPQDQLQYIVLGQQKPK